MRKSVVATLSGVALFLLLSGCASDNSSHPPIPISDWKVQSKWIEDWEDPEPCYKFSMSKVEKEWNKKRGEYEIHAVKGYACVPTKAYESLDIGDTYRIEDWWVK